MVLALCLALHDLTHAQLGAFGHGVVRGCQPFAIVEARLKLGKTAELRSKVEWRHYLLVLISRVNGPSCAQSVVLDFRLARCSLLVLHHLTWAGQSPRQARFLELLTGLVGSVSRRFQTCTTCHISYTIDDGQSQVKVQCCSHRFGHESLHAWLFLDALGLIGGTHLFLLTVNDLPDLQMVLNVRFPIARQGKRQILDRHLQPAPQGILDAIDGTSGEHFELDVLSQRILGLAAADIRLTRDLDIVLPAVALARTLLHGP